MVKFNCSLCGFSIEKDKKPERCPYCSKGNVMVEEESAEALLLEA